MSTVPLNITWQGHSGTAHGVLNDNAPDSDVKRIAVEIVRSGGLVDGPYDPDLSEHAFADFVVDRLEGVVYLRPKVPFGDHDPLRCPTCNSPDPRAHPSVSGGGEVTTICPDPFHDPMTPGFPDPCQPIGCDNGIHLSGCAFLPQDLSDAPCKVYASGLHRCECNAVWGVRRVPTYSTSVNDSHRGEGEGV